MYEGDFVIGDKEDDGYNFYEDAKKRTEKRPEKHDSKSTVIRHPPKEYPKLFDIHKAKVRGIKSFGIFVEILEFPDVSTLVPKRFAVNYEIDDLNKVVELGQTVYVKVLFFAGFIRTTAFS